jgi:SAM-dependent methyltransferase
MTSRDLAKAALRGEPSYVWQAGQVRRFQMLLDSAEERIHGCVLENGCGVGMYTQKITPLAETVIGLEYDFRRAVEAHVKSRHIINAAGEGLAFPDNSFDLMLSHEVIEHVQDDRAAIAEMVRTLRYGGRVVIFCPNRGYPFETHGIYWRGKYKFGNIPLVNWLPSSWRDKLAPHVKVYTRRDMMRLFQGLPVIFGAYDNIIHRFPQLGRALRVALQFLEHTPLRIFGLSHYWVVEKLQPTP